MTPAFSSPRQAAAFALLLALLLASPVLMAKTGWLNRRDAYLAMPVKTGPVAWIQQQIFSRTNEVDIAFLGASHIWTGVNTPYVQKKLSERIGREGEVITLAWNWPGYDADYVVARDLFQHRHVRMLVIDDEDNLAYPDAPQEQSWRWLRMGENSDALVGLSWPVRVEIYGGMVLGTPRNLLSLMRRNLIENPAEHQDDYWKTTFGAANFAKEQGALRARIGYYGKDFSPCAPPTHTTPADAVIYSNQTRGSFIFTGPPVRPYHLFFARKLAQLCRDNGTRLVVLHMPLLKESAQPTIPERESWEQVLGMPVDVVGIPGAKLFEGAANQDATRFFYNDVHMNQNGQDRFTQLVTPALLELYASTNHS